MTNISIGIVTYNNKKTEIDSLLNSLLNSTFEVDIFIFDNSDNREIKGYLNNEKIMYIPSSKNVGFGTGHNRILSKTSNLNYKYHVFLNPDVRIESDTIEKLFNYMENNHDVGIITPKIKYPNGETQFLCKLIPTPLDLIRRRFLPLGKHGRTIDAKYELRFTGYNKIMEIPIISGAFMFARMSVLQKTGGFDERYFMYNEDVDLCRRINKHSRIVFHPHTSITHEYAKGSYKNPKLLLYHIKSAIKYFNKWGWIFDKERKRVNNEALKRLSS